jgi:hypothetical protein
MKQLLSALLCVFLMTSCSLGYPPKVPEPDPPATIPVPEEEIIEEVIDDSDGTGPIHHRVKRVIKKAAVPPTQVETPIPDDTDPCRALVSENNSLTTVDKKLDCLIQNPRPLK